MEEEIPRVCGSPAEAQSPQPKPKRRKVRKGTQSCWECKRLKSRCSFATPTDTVCRGCNRRGTNCISQEVPQEIALVGKSIPLGDRLGRVEVLMEVLARKIDGTVDKSLLASSQSDQVDRGCEAEPRIPSGRYCPPDIISLDHDREQSTSPNKPARPVPSLKQSLLPEYYKITKRLLAAWPSQSDLDLIVGLPLGMQDLQHSAIAVYMSYSNLQDQPSIGELLRLPASGSHPSLLAQKLLILGSFLQSVQSCRTRDLEALSVNYHDIQSCVIETANREVTSKDELVGSIEGIECIMMESMYRSNSGNLRRSWLTLRRGMLIAQMMSLYRGDTSPSLVVLETETRNRINSEQMWFRLVHTDRYLSLMLGLPQGSTDDSFAAPMVLEGCKPRERMERMVSGAAGRIVQRNHTDMLDLTATQDIDELLQNASANMPAQWWLAPHLMSTVDDDGVILRKTMRIMDQFIHYNLLVQLHLPFVLRFSTDRKYDYSKIMAVNASRELLMRFLSFEDFTKDAECCYGIKFFAFIASTTLCLAHIHSYGQRQVCIDEDSRTVVKLLAHERLVDRGILERTLECMQRIADSDTVALRIADVLYHLLDIESDAGNGGVYCSTSSSGEGKVELECGEVSDGGNVLRIYIPYCGTVKVERGSVSKSVFKMPEAPNVTLTDSTGGSSLPARQEDVLRPRYQAGVQSVNQCTQILSPNNDCFNNFEDTSAGDSQVFLPELVASVDDWALQGVDLALFDSLIGGPECES